MDNIQKSKKKITRIQALLTAMGIMIGAGIYFKADDIMIAVNGDFTLAMIIWVIITIGFIFSSLAVSKIVVNSNPDGGVVGYLESHFGNLVGFGMGWFQITLYVPILISILSTVTISYFGQLMNIEFTALETLIYSLILILAVAIWNYLSTIISILISVTATYIKVIPLIVIVIYGFVAGDPGELNFAPSSNTVTGIASFLTPFIAIAFMFDGWLSAGSLSVDMKNPKKDIPFVLVGSILLTSLIYILYFVGVNLLLDYNSLQSAGDGYLAKIFGQLLNNDMLSKLVLVFVIVSVIGTLNAMFIAGNRYCEELANKNLMFASDFFKKRTKQNTLLNASYVTSAFVAFFIFLIYLQNTQFTILNFEIFGDIEFDNTIVACGALALCMIFLISFKLFKEKKVNWFYGIMAPTIGIILQLLIVSGFLMSSDNVKIPIIFMLVACMIVAIGFIINKKELFNKQ